MRAALLALLLAAALPAIEYKDGYANSNGVKIHYATYGKQDGPLWRSGGYVYDAITGSPAGYLPGWKRSGAEPAIARLVIRPEHPALGLVDGDQFRDGEWTTVQDLGPAARRDGTFVLSWDEVYNVIDGNARRATYVNVPPGQYTFRAMGLAGDGEVTGDQLALSVVIEPPFWQHLWFWPMVAAGIVATISGVIFGLHRQRAKRSMEKLRFQNALEKDRMRIARDMHDDLGSTLASIVHLSEPSATAGPAAPSLAATSERSPVCLYSPEYAVNVPARDARGPRGVGCESAR